jgi:hypothetical protein
MNTQDWTRTKELLNRTLSDSEKLDLLIELIESLVTRISLLEADFHHLDRD